MYNKEIELFSKKIKTHDENSKKKEEKERMNRGLDYLIELKDNINLNFEDLPENSKMNEDKKKELKEKMKKIEISVKYNELLKNILNYFTYLENKGCPFLIDIKIQNRKII